MRFLPDGKFIAFINSKNWNQAGFTHLKQNPDEVWLLRIADGATLKMDGDFTAVSSLAVSPDGKRLAAAGEGAPVIWKISQGKLEQGQGETLTDFPKIGSIGAVTFTPDSSRLLAVSHDQGTIADWDVESNVLRHNLSNRGNNAMHFAKTVVVPNKNVDEAFITTYGGGVLIWNFDEFDGTSP